MFAHFTTSVNDRLQRVWIKNKLMYLNLHGLTSLFVYLQFTIKFCHCSLCDTPVLHSLRLKNGKFKLSWFNLGGKKFNIWLSPLWFHTRLICVYMAVFYVKEKYYGHETLNFVLMDLFLCSFGVLQLYYRFLCLPNMSY